MVVVVPCFQEDDLIGSLESLRACGPPSRAVEVIVVVNSSSHSGDDVLHQNQKSWEAFQSWNEGSHPSWLRFHCLHHPDLPPKHAGVGLARKIGMDEALHRFARVDNLEGAIVCYDADCRCDADYLRQIDCHFQKHPATPGCSIYFEHPGQGGYGDAIHAAAISYELHLRYYLRGLRHAGLPYAFYTIGSCMAVRAWAYLKQGGMNRRQAGEDFYFLHKIIALGGFTELNTTRVIPSPRPSHRVPFGTGRAVQAILRDGCFASYPVQAFEDLKALVHWVRTPITASAPDWENARFSEVLCDFLRKHGATEAWGEIKRNTSSVAALQKRFFQWFDAFRAMKFIHHARDNAYGSPEVGEAARELLKRMGHGDGSDSGGVLETRALLDVYRRWDRTGTL